jgi:hypothetical protein
MTKFEFTFNARIPYDAEEDPRDVTIAFTTSDLDEVVRQFNKLLILNDFDAEVAVV